MAKNTTDKFVATVEDYFSKLPPIPKSWQDFIVKIVPWIALILGILGVISSLGDLTDASARALFGLVASALLLASFPGLNSKKMSGWTLLFWSRIASIVANVAGLDAGGVIGQLVLLYFVFQIKSYYK